jgi:S1-C subfamily serine protease
MEKPMPQRDKSNRLSLPKGMIRAARSSTAVAQAHIGILALLLLASTAAQAQDAIKNGTAFAINSRGEFLTNDHVVKGCATLRLRWDGEKHDAAVVASDQQNDLAVVRTSGSEVEPLKFREGKGIRPGDGIVALGFPYSGLLSTSVQVTTGDVSALTGIRDDIRFLQLTAPVQPGNSGGPLLDLSGNVVGIVSARINDLAVAEVTGSLPQNINFAIKSAVIRTFLEAHQIAYETAQSSAQVGPADVAEAASKSTLLLECFNNLPREAAASPAPTASQPPSPKSDSPGQTPISGTTTVCGRPVNYFINRLETTPNYSTLLGIWTGVWSNASKICGGLIIQKVKDDGSATVIYVYGPSSSLSSFPWKEQSGLAHVAGGEISFVDDQGNKFTFDAAGSGLLTGTFLSPSGRLHSSFAKTD